MRLRPHDPPAATLALVAGVALHHAIAPLAHNVLLKWPNDLVAGDAKLAGILLEREAERVVVGFGVNLVASPEIPDRATTCLSAIAGVPPNAAAVAEGLASCFVKWLATWRDEGVEPVRQAWLKAAHPIGTPLATGEGPGLFAGLDESGALRLRTGDGSIRLINAGDVFLIS